LTGAAMFASYGEQGSEGGAGELPGLAQGAAGGGPGRSLARRIRVARNLARNDYGRPGFALGRP
jgi:hypothetical protein